MIAHVAVLIPARNEHKRIDACLRSVHKAASLSPVPVSIVVVADRCTDGTARHASAFPDVRVLITDLGNVGAARALAAQFVFETTVVEPSDLWFACTDADSQVPPNWISSQVEKADTGVDLIVGTVRPDPVEYPEGLQEKWRQTHVRGEPNGHVHGANLGVRASSYQAVGGFRALTEHEDVDLVARLRGFRFVASDEAEVLTSARLTGRTPGGYAGYLRGENATDRKELK